MIKTVTKRWRKNMKKVSAILGVAALTLCCATFTAQASHFEHDGYKDHVNTSVKDNKNVNRGPRGLQNQNDRNVKEVLNEAKDDEIVVVQGRLTRFLGDDKYELTDNNNDSIVVELDDDRDWSYIAKDQPIEVVAKVDKDLLSTKLDVKDAIPLKPLHEYTLDPVNPDGPRNDTKDIKK